MFARFQSARKLIAPLALLGAGLVLTACEDTVSDGPSIDTRSPIPVAMLLPKGSTDPNDVLLSESLENAARLAIADLQGVAVDLRIYDTAANADLAAQQAQLAVDSGAKIILGPLYSASAIAAGAAVADEGVNVLSFSNNTTIAGGNVFVLGHTFDNTAARLARYASRQGKSQIAVMHASNEAGEIAGRAVARASLEAGTFLVSEVSYPLTQEGVIEAVPQVRDAIEETSADVIFLTSNTAGALPFLSALLPEAGVDPETVQYIGLTRWDIPAQTLELPGVQGGWFALPDPDRTAAFQLRYEVAYGTQPHRFGSLAYDGIAAIGALVASQGRDALTIAALTQGQGFEGVDGVFRLNRDGTIERGLAVAQVIDEKVVVIDPAPHIFSVAGLE
ncbi:MAG: penicillin-binding protein activator [Paracoccaceae bacterium]|nr:penicillin-binding protein activator [Paracoccaceae bacterium]